MVNLDIKQRQAPKQKTTNKIIPLLDSSKSGPVNVHNKLRQSLARMENEYSARKVEGEQARLHSAVQSDDIQMIDHQNFLEEQPDNRHLSSLKRLIDESDNLALAAGMPKAQFLANDLLEKLREAGGGSVNCPPTPKRLGDLAEIYQTDNTAAKTRPKEIKDHQNIQKLKTNNIESESWNNLPTAISLLEVLGKIGGKTLAKDNIKDFLNDERYNEDLPKYPEELNQKYLEAVEVGRLEKSAASIQSAGFQLSSGGSGTEVKEGVDFNFESHNLEAIAETYQENFTRTNNLGSFEVWAKIGDYRFIISRCGI